MTCSIIEVPLTGEVVRYTATTVIVIVFNSVMMYVWLKPSNRSAITLCLALLGVSDMLTMATATISVLSRYYSTDWSGISLCRVVKVSNKLSDMFHFVSLLITTSMAVQRFIVCGLPFRGRLLCNKRTQVLQLAICGILPVLFITPYLIEISGLVDITVHIEWTNSTNLTETTCLKENTCSPTCFKYVDLSKVSTTTKACKASHSMKERARWILSVCILTFLRILPTIVIVFCMSYCLFKMCGSAKKGSKATVAHKSFISRKGHFLLIVIILRVVIGEVPSTISHVLEMIYTTESQRDVWLLSSTGKTFCKIITALSYLQNTVIYTIMSKQFRITLFNMFSCRKKSKIKHPDFSRNQESTVIWNDRNIQNKYWGHKCDKEGKKRNNCEHEEYEVSCMVGGCEEHQNRGILRVTLF